MRKVFASVALTSTGLAVARVASCMAAPARAENFMVKVDKYC